MLPFCRAYSRCILEPIDRVITTSYAQTFVEISCWRTMISALVSIHTVRPKAKLRNVFFKYKIFSVNILFTKFSLSWNIMRFWGTVWITYYTVVIINNIFKHYLTEGDKNYCLYKKNKNVWVVFTKFKTVFPHCWISLKRIILWNSPMSGLDQPNLY